MNKGSNLKPPDIAAIAYLAKAGHKPKYISETTGISLRSCERWSKAFRDNNYQDLPLPKKPQGKARKVSPRGVSILRRDVERNPRISAKQLKEQNPYILENVSERTVQRILKRDLQYKYRCAWKKPIQTRRQIRNRIKFGKENKDWTPAKCKRVLWSDESIFTVTGNHGRPFGHKVWGASSHLAQPMQEAGIVHFHFPETFTHYLQ